jgi:hypothetical protein
MTDEQNVAALCKAVEIYAEKWKRNEVELEKHPPFYAVKESPSENLFKKANDINLPFFSQWHSLQNIVHYLTDKNSFCSMGSSLFDLSTEKKSGFREGFLIATERDKQDTFQVNYTETIIKRKENISFYVCLSLGTITKKINPDRTFQDWLFGEKNEFIYTVKLINFTAFYSFQNLEEKEAD